MKKAALVTVFLLLVIPCWVNSQIPLTFSFKKDGKTYSENSISYFLEVSRDSKVERFSSGEELDFSNVERGQISLATKLIHDVNQVSRELYCLVAGAQVVISQDLS